LDEVVEWAEKVGSDYLFVETAGLCLRCSPYVEKSLGVVVLEATSGMNLPRKIGPMLTLADISVITKIDLISQAEREVFRYRVLESAKDITVVETNALYGIGIDPIVRQILKTNDVELPDVPQRKSSCRHLYYLCWEERDRGQESFWSFTYNGTGTFLCR
jgi:Ni2+-binding GTPase involved in maturation of urease and hydrogenase